MNQLCARCRDRLRPHSWCGLDRAGFRISGASRRQFPSITRQATFRATRVAVSRLIQQAAGPFSRSRSRRPESSQSPQHANRRTDSSMSQCMLLTTRNRHNNRSPLPGTRAHREDIGRRPKEVVSADSASLIVAPVPRSRRSSV